MQGIEDIPLPRSQSPRPSLDLETLTMTGTESPDAELIKKVTAFVEDYMSKYDGSHDFSHILRVLAYSRRLSVAIPHLYNPLVVTLAALMHDVGDKKYLKPGENSTLLVRDTLIGMGADKALAEKVQAIVIGVSYSFEIKNPDRVAELIELHPELAVVQDADRLDALGAIGIGRAFTYGGAAGGTTRGKGMGETINHFKEKLERLEGMMKTKAGRQMARTKTERIKKFTSWWMDELDRASCWSD